MLRTRKLLRVLKLATHAHGPTSFVELPKQYIERIVRIDHVTIRPILSPNSVRPNQGLDGKEQTRRNGNVQKWFANVQSSSLLGSIDLFAFLHVARPKRLVSMEGYVGTDAWQGLSFPPNERRPVSIRFLERNLNEHLEQLEG